jgi:DNA-directed RNA polymerase II subunit RPB9
MRHDISSTVGATAGVTAEVAQDPTVGLSHPSEEEASLSEGLPCCTMCGMDIVCVECGEDWAPGFALEAEDEQPAAGPQEAFFDGFDYEDFESDEDMEDESS